MVRETRHLWVGNLPDNIREDRIRELFKRYGRVQNVKLLGRTDNVTTGVGAGGASGICATVAFMDIKSASKAHNAEHVLDERTLTTEYYEPAAIPSAAGAPSAGSSPAGSGYSGSSSSVNSTPAPASVSRYHLSGGEDSSSNTCPIAASAAAPATWRGTNDSATEYCRRGNTPAAYGRYQRNNSTAPYSTPPSNVERTANRWYPSGDRMAGGESTPSTPGGATEGGRRRRHSGSGSSRSESSSPEPSDTSRASTPATQPLSHHTNHRTPPSLQHQWATTASGRPLAICVRNLPTRSTDSSLKDGLYHEYKKHGKVVWVKVVGQNADRYAVVRFKKPSDVEKAIEVSQDKLFFGCKITVAPHQSCDEDADSAKPYETDIDEYHPKATRTLFIGNLEKDVTQQQLRDKFKHFGRIIEIDIKKGSSGGAGYAFCQYASISSVVEAIRSMDGEYVGGSRVKLGFGKPVATTCVWVDGLTEHTEKQVLSAVSRCGGATSVCVDRAAGAALVHFEQAAAAGAAVRELRRVAAAVSAAEPDHPRLCVDYASRECQEAFYEQLEKHGGSAALTGSERLSGDLATRYLPPTRHEAIRFDGTRSRASSYGRGSSRTPRYSTLEHYDPTDYAADRRYRVYDEVGSSPQPEETSYEERLQSVVVSPHRARHHRRDSSPDDRKHSKERHRSVGTRRSRSGSRGGERHGARRRHRRRRDGSGSHSRAGTPLRDEPDAPPVEPRRAPRERPPLPMSLPLPKFAAQLLRTAPPTPRPAPAPAPDSPPRPPSASSSSGGSAPHSPSLDERIRSLDEKLNGSRALSDVPDRARLRHRLLDVDINEVKPSEVVRSLLAKRSVFDEDSERLEGAGRAPSPSGSPRGRASAPTPRALRYPFPTHRPLPAPAAGAPHDSDGDSCESPGRSRLDSRARPRTPPPPPEPEPAVERERIPRDYHEFDVNAHMRRPLGCSDLSVVTPCIKEDRADGEATIRACHDLNTNNSSPLSSLSSQTINYVDSKLMSTESAMTGSLSAKSEIFDQSNKTEVSHTFQLEDDSAREVLDMLLKQVEKLNESPKYDSLFDKRFNFSKEIITKSELHKQEDRLKLDNENKLNLLCQTDNHKSESQEKQITKELLEFEMQHSHLNTINLIKPSSADLSQENLNNNENLLKDRHNHNYHNTKLEKENINSFDNSFIKEKSFNIVSLPNKKNADSEKDHDECSRNERDKARHCKDKIAKDNHESEKEKLKMCKPERNVEKDKKPKEDQYCERHINDKVKTEKDGEKSHKEKNDKECDKTKHIEDKSYRHDHHKKDRSDREKRKDSVDVEVTSSKVKKEDKYKHDRSKKDDSKREGKKESETLKNRKSSRDETSRDLSRKDSTDSSTSRASHESTKIKDLEINETKEDLKNKLKHTEILAKRESDRDLSLKGEIKDEKDLGNHSTVKNESTQEHIPKSKPDMSEKQRHYSLDSPSVDTKRKERLNSCSSLPSNIGHKRRMSSQDSFDLFNEDFKKCKSDTKIPERRSSKDSRSENRHKTTKFSKGHFVKIIESKTKDDKKNQVKPPDESYVESKDNDSKDPKITDKPKTFKKCHKDETEDTSNTDIPSEGLHNDLDFLATLELRSSEEDERQRALRKEMKEKKRIQQLQQIQELQMQQDALHQSELVGKIKDEKKKCDEKKKDAAREKRFSTDRKSRDERIDNNKRKNRKPVHSSGDSSDSDEPKKHSIFDIIDDGPTYISMYDKVKARSCKNMQKQEEEKRQEKIKAKFSQLKQSRAKREEKKRSSWDEDSDSDPDRKKYQKSSLDNSSDDGIAIHKRREKSHCFDHSHSKIDAYFDGSVNEEDMRNKLARKNSRSRIMSDTSDDETCKRSISRSPNFLDSIKKELLSDSESIQRIKSGDAKDLNESNSKKNSLLNLFGKSDSDDSKIKINLENDNGYKSNYIKSLCNDFSSESESACNKNLENRKKHKKRQKKHKSTYSDDETKLENSDTSLLEAYKHKNIEKQRRHSNKKDKRKEKLRDSVDTDDTRDEKHKLKKEKKSSNNNFDIVTESICNTMKKEGKMEDIFGPLSDESDRDTRECMTHKSDFSAHVIESSFCTSTEYKIKDNERRKKERKRKENRYLKDDDNSLDVDAVSKAIEARLFADSLVDDESRIRVETLSESLNKIENSGVKYTEGNIISELVRHEKLKRECREKKKKKKKSREDRQNRKEHHHFYHEEKNEKSDHVSENIMVSPKTMLLDIPLPNDVQTANIMEKAENCEALLESHSLPRLTDSPPIVIQSEENKDSNRINSYNVIDDSKIEYVESKEIEIEEIPMPPPFETLVTDISEVPLPKDPLPSKHHHSREESFLSSLSSDGDSCEDAVRNISSSEKEVEKTENTSDIVESVPCKTEKKTDEKPRAIISQEETEDAVAALLGESFGGKINTFSSCYEKTENITNNTIESESATIENENIPEEDAEEMRQAVQNLNASEMEIKPDTPVSDNDLLLIDTDTEETDETHQENIEKIPVNIIATNQAFTSISAQNKGDVANTDVSETKSNLISSATTSESKISNIKSNEDVKIQLPKRENVQIITSTATPVITSWTLTNNKLVEPHVLNIQANSISSKDKTDLKPTHITANIVQIKGPQNQTVQINNTSRPIMTQTRVNTPYQVINQMIRTQAPNVQPPTIKIPDPHILYQKPQGIVISPRMSIDPRMQSPKSNAQNESMTSPRLTNMTILSTSQNINSVGMASPNAIQQRSPGQVTVVRMQQPPLSPIQTMHIPHGTRTMLSPNRPSSVLVQTQGTPIHFNRLPVTPVLAPISKQINVNNLVQQNKAIGVTTTPLIHQQKIITGENRKNDQRSFSENTHDTSKIILSPTNLKHSTNPTVMAQNRLMSMQNAIHVSNINTVHLNNKVLINTVSQLNDKRENQSQKSDKVNHIPFGPTPIIHVAGVNNPTTSIIQSGTRSITNNAQEPNATNRSQGSNVIHSLSSQRVLTQAPLSNVIKIDANKVPTSVLSMATIRQPSVLAKLELSTTSTVTTTSTTNMTPLLLKTTSPTGPVRLNTKLDTDSMEPLKSFVFQNNARDNESKVIDKDLNKSVDVTCGAVKEQRDSLPKQELSSSEYVTKCETDFEELLKDNTNEIKVTNDPEKKLEVNVGKTVTLISTSNHKDVLKKSDNIRKENVDDMNQGQSQSMPLFSDVIEKKHSESKENVASRTENSTVKSSCDTVVLEKAKFSGKDMTISISESEKTIDNVFKAEEPNFEVVLPNDLELNDSAIKNDENDSWSAKDVNIESVIKTVDSLCNENAENDLNCDVKSKEALDSIKVDNSEKELLHSSLIIKSTNVNMQIMENVIDCKVLEEVTDKITPTVTAKRGGGRNVRGRRFDKSVDRIQTRQISKPRGAPTAKRGRGRAKVDKKIKSLVNSSANTMPGDVYDFHEDSGDETAASPNKTEARPRLILTIKSPISGQSTITASSTLSITPKDQIKLDKNKEEKNEEFISPSPNTRKSRRLQEKDVQRSFVDDIIEDVIKGSTGQLRMGKEAGNKKRPTRQAIKANHEKCSDTRKSPRGTKRTRDQSLSDASVDSGDEKSIRESPRDAKAPRLDEPALDSEPVATPRPAPAPAPSVTAAPGAAIASTGPVAPVVPVPIPAPTSTPTPITKPPKKMISEISAKLAGAFDVGIAANPAERTATEAPASPLAQAGGDPRARRLADAVPGALVPVGAAEAGDARVQSPALPHRPPSAPATPPALRPADRATPLLVRSVARAARLERPADADDAVRVFRGYAATASLPRGAHHPPHPPPDHLKQVGAVPQHPHHPGAASRVTIASIPAISPQGQIGMGDGMYPHFSHQHYQMYQQHFRATQHDSRATPSPYTRSLEAEGSEAPTPPLELRRPPSARVPPGERAERPERAEYEPGAAFRRDVVRRAPVAVYAVGCVGSPPPAHSSRLPPALPPGAAPGPPHASQVPREADSLQMLLRRYPVMWQGLLALKNDSAAVQMHFVGGNPGVAGDTLSRHADGSTPLLRIAQRMRLEQPQLDQVHRKMKLEHEHCMLLALPCGRDHMDVLQQSTNLTAGFITYLQRKQAAGIVNIAPPGHQQAMFTVHIFPSCEFANENLNRIAPDLMHRVADIAHLLIVIATV